jgi:DNA-binding LacI/PurR family transcriptional regulator
MAAEMILALIDHQPVAEKQFVFACELIERQSCRPLPIETRAHSQEK